MENYAAKITRLICIYIHTYIVSRSVDRFGSNRSFTKRLFIDPHDNRHYRQERVPEREREKMRERVPERDRVRVCSLLIALSLFPFPFPLRFCQIVDHAPIRCSRSVTAWYFATLAAPRQPKITQHNAIFMMLEFSLCCAVYLPQSFYSASSISSTYARSAGQRLQLITVSSRAPRF